MSVDAEKFVEEIISNPIYNHFILGQCLAVEDDVRFCINTRGHLQVKDAYHEQPLPLQDYLEELAVVCDAEFSLTQDERDALIFSYATMKEFVFELRSKGIDG